MACENKSVRTLLSIFRSVILFKSYVFNLRGSVKIIYTAENIKKYIKYIVRNIPGGSNKGLIFSKIP